MCIALLWQNPCWEGLSWVEVRWSKVRVSVGVSVRVRVYISMHNDARLLHFSPCLLF